MLPLQHARRPERIPDARQGKRETQARQKEGKDGAPLLTWAREHLIARERDKGLLLGLLLPLSAVKFEP